jgi:hypothetical protein
VTRVLVRYARGGGRTPADDESLEIAEGGGFEARRTVGGARVGRFAGTLPGSTLRGLGSSIRAVAAAQDLSIPTPRDGATETIEVEGRVAQLDGNAQPPAPWKSLVTKLRRLLDERAVDTPVAALELSPDGTRLSHLGHEELAVDPSSIAVRRVALAADGVPTEHRFSGATDDAATRGTGSWTQAGPGWSIALPGDSLPPGSAGQVWVTLRVRDGEASRLVRLFRSLGGQR